MLHVQVESFDVWRILARKLLASQKAPREVEWRDANRRQPFLGFADADARSQAMLGEYPTEPLFDGALVKVPRRFLRLAERVAAHRDERKWDLLYQALWRLAHGERHLLELETDDLVHRLLAMEKSVRKDAHKMKAFVRFRRCAEENAGEKPDSVLVDDVGSDCYIAFHRPQHRVVRLVAPFFVRRFGLMRWAVLTPDESAYWDGRLLRFGPGVSATSAPASDALEDLWKTYYAATFNPARLNLPLMRREMPRRHRPTLPETQRIGDPVQDSPRRLEQMLAHREGVVHSARDFLPFDRSLASLARAARTCEGCTLCQSATQTVFGEGRADARLVFIGEQPGDQEDRAGRPFVGPAGKVFDEALAQVGIDRSQVYVTNAVKHFKWTPRGQMRLHAKPNAREMAACRPWLEAEIAAIKPQMVVCLGATAAQVVVGPEFRITQQHGQVLPTAFAPWTMATYHPSALLRVPDETTRLQMQEQFIYDLQRVAQQFALLKSECVGKG